MVDVTTGKQTSHVEIDIFGPWGPLNAKQGALRFHLGAILLFFWNKKKSQTQKVYRKGKMESSRLSHLLYGAFGERWLSADGITARASKTDSEPCQLVSLLVPQISASTFFAWLPATVHARMICEWQYFVRARRSETGHVPQTSSLRLLVVLVCSKLLFQAPAELAAKAKVTTQPGPQLQG